MLDCWNQLFALKQEFGSCPEWPTRVFIRSFSSAGRGFGAPSIINHVALPEYDFNDPLHGSLSSLSQRAHALASRGKEVEEELRRVEDEIYQKAAEVWGLTEEELKDIERWLKEN